MPQQLKISAFKDISAFVLETMRTRTAFNFEIKYVHNADEAHNDLKQHTADIVFMSYDDTLSMTLEDRYTDVAAFMPIHGGMLDLCGTIDLATNKNRIGIDTNSGYARALRIYLQHRFPKKQDYQKIRWVMAGATNIRYQKLLDNEIDATLLNPPFSYLPDIKRIDFLSAIMGNNYQGVVANLNKSWVENPGNQESLNNFIVYYQQTINWMQRNPQDTIKKLIDFYPDSIDTASCIYNRLWQSDGLNNSLKFDDLALSGTEKIFTDDTHITVPPLRSWIISQDTKV